MITYRTCRCVGAIAGLAAMLAVAACAPAPGTTTRPDPVQEAQPAIAAAEVPLAELIVHAPFPSFMMTANDQAGDYYSVVSKVTWSIAADGSLRLIGDGAEPVIGGNDETGDFDCGTHGGGFNQRTAWFPSTALFVHGGTLLGVSPAQGPKPVLRTLSVEPEDGSMIYRGDSARTPEYSYIPCVGATRVDRGHRLDGYLAGNDRLLLQDAAGRAMTIALPQPFAPFVLARYRDGALIPVPMRIVVAGVDVPARRVVVQLQATLGQSPAIRVLEVRAVLPDGAPGEGEALARYAERTRALLADLAQCRAPVEQAIEPCADPTRAPDPLIIASPD
ncbi:MAG: hypothetical protein EOP90_02460 [Lysobacteraceae bacterium]|nr:MAG: hypothetical protein EOP90_02460 [Xanthomonadaceae bacterium]